MISNVRVENTILPNYSLFPLFRLYFGEGIAEQHAIEKVDISLVEIRDAIAHGRLTAQDPRQPESPFGLPMRLVKFDRPVNGQTKMIFNDILNASWFEKQQIRAVVAHNIVWIALHSLDSYNETLKL